MPISMDIADVEAAAADAVVNEAIEAMVLVPISILAARYQTIVWRDF